MPWKDEFECMPVEQLEALQLKHLKETVSWVAEKIPFYQKKLKEMGITADDIASVQDAAKLPFTVKEDLRDEYPFGLCGVPLKDVVRVHASSGTTGKPITGPYTAGDLDNWSECMARNTAKLSVYQEAHRPSKAAPPSGSTTAVSPLSQNSDDAPEADFQTAMKMVRFRL